MAQRGSQRDQNGQQLLIMTVFFHCIILLLLFIFWTLVIQLTDLFLCLYSFPESKVKDLLFRAIKMVHGSVSFTLSSVVYLNQSFQPDSLVSQDIKQLVMLFSLSFFLYDTILGLYLRVIFTSLVIHHIVCVVLIGSWMLWPQLLVYHFKYFFIAMVTMQVSNTAMNLREILRHCNLRWTKTFHYVEMSFMYSFLFARNILAPLLFVPFIMETELNLFFRGSMLFLFVYSVHSSLSILRKLKVRHRQSQEMLQKQVCLQWFAQEQKQLERLSFYHEKEDRII